VTVAVTIAADGTVLPSTLVFKGKPVGRIEKSEFSTYPNGHFYKCQENAWMDEATEFAIAPSDMVRGCEQDCVEELCWLFFVPCKQSTPMCVLKRTPEQ
jgi:hypothetical protein